MIIPFTPDELRFLDMTASLFGMTDIPTLKGHVTLVSLFVKITPNVYEGEDLAKFTADHAEMWEELRLAGEVTGPVPVHPKGPIDFTQDEFILIRVVMLWFGEQCPTDFLGRDNVLNILEKCAIHNPNITEDERQVALLSIEALRAMATTSH